MVELEKVVVVGDSAQIGGKAGSLEGLSSKEVDSLRSQYGFNEIKSQEKPLILKFLSHFWGLSAWLLEAAVVASFALRKWVDGTVPLILLVVNALLGFQQDRKADAALKSLQSQLQITVRAKRDGEWVPLPAREVLPGDIIKLRQGDVIAADSVHQSGTELSVDQSALTGESHPVDRGPGSELYAGSIIRSGEAIALVQHIGKETKFGKTADLVAVAKPKLHSESLLRKVVYTKIGVTAVLIIVTIAVIAARKHSIVNRIPFFITLLVTAVPVALPAMLTITMALGSNQLSKRKVLVARLNATEDAARMTVLCSDKTGTITTNRLTVKRLFPAIGFTEEQLLLYAAAASKAENHDVIDDAALTAASARGVSLDSYEVLDFVPFDASTRFTQATLSAKDKQERFFVRKGAVTTLLKQCALSEQDLASWNEQMLSCSSVGERTLAVVRENGSNGGVTPPKAETETPGAAVVEKIAPSEPQFSFVGLLSFTDPPRDDSKTVIATLNQLGIRVVMITGDSIHIAKNIGAQVNLDPERMLSLEEWRNRGKGKGAGESPRLRKRSVPVELEKARSVLELPPVEKLSGFAEVFPEDKHFIVKQLQQQKFVVGMTGDGVNDAPALKQAEVGVAVSNATDVAKAAASAIMLKEGLTGVIDMVVTGRKIHARLVTWVLSYVVRTFQQPVFVMLMYWIRGEFPVASIHLLIQILLQDFVTLAISTDRVYWTRSPSTWRFWWLCLIAAVLGFMNLGQMVGGMYFALEVLEGYKGNLRKIQTFNFSMLMSFTLLSILVQRERDWFCKSWPSWQLVLALVCDYVIVLILCTVGVGWLKLHHISLWDQGWILLFALISRFFMIDPVKWLLFKYLIPEMQN